MNKIVLKKQKDPHLSWPCVSRVARQGFRTLPFLGPIGQRLIKIFLNHIFLILIGLLDIVKISYRVVDGYEHKHKTAKYLILSAMVLSMFVSVSVGQSEVKKNQNIETVIANGHADAELGQISNEISWEAWEQDFIIPVSGYKSQGYRRGHPGIDYAAKIYSDIHPVTAGKVVHVGWEDGGYGLTVIVDHDHGLVARYAHMAKTDVNVGDSVKTATVIGQVGLTGHTTGPHVHVELYDKETNINPEDFVPLVK